MFYDDHAAELAARYERLRFEDVHAGLLDLLPAHGAILDVGAGSGRDAAWLVAHGYRVVAVEPSVPMQAVAQRCHPHLAARWVRDSLPSLAEVHRLGLAFDFILVSGVWMHVLRAERPRALRALVALLKPGGRIAVSLRLGPSDPERQMYPVSQQELERLASDCGLVVLRVAPAADLLGRPDVQWVTVVLALP